MTALFGTESVKHGEAKTLETKESKSKSRVADTANADAMNKAFGSRPDLTPITTLGGNKRVVGNLEILFPMPFMKDDRSLRLSTFIDGGSVFAGKVDLNEMRYSAGFAVSWISPMGPLKISLAKPLNDKPGDNLQVLQFQFGQRF